MALDELIQMLVRHEGLDLKPYLDSKGILTIGVGRNLEQVGISRDEALSLLANDIGTIQKQLNDQCPWFKTLDPIRQDAIIDMAFMGVQKVKEFQKMIDAIVSKNYDVAANEMLNSTWANEVGKRAEDLARIMRTGSYF